MLNIDIINDFYFLGIGGRFWKGGKKMKKLIVLLIMGLLLSGCSDEFLAHDSLFKNWDHTKFSWGGYKDVSATDVQNSNQQGWWGEEIPYIPAE